MNSPLANAYEGDPSQAVIVAEVFWTGEHFDYNVTVSARLNRYPDQTRYLFSHLITAIIEAQERVSHNKRTYDAQQDPTARTSNADE